jgi:hypothetical protein
MDKSPSRRKRSQEKEADVKLSSAFLEIGCQSDVKFESSKYKKGDKRNI